MWLKNSDGRPSASLTLAIVAFAVVTVSFIVGLFPQIGPLQTRAFDPLACSAYLAPCLALYFGRRSTEAGVTKELAKLDGGSNG